MTKFPYLALLYSLTIPVTVLANPTNETQCDDLFTSLIESEPYIKDELQSLESGCKKQLTTEDTRYWSCIHQRMSSGLVTFDRFIVSANLCEDRNAMVTAR